MDSNPEVLKIIAQGVINSLFAKRLIRFPPTVLKVVEEGSFRFGIHLDDRRLTKRAPTMKLIVTLLFVHEYKPVAVSATGLRGLAV